MMGGAIILFPGCVSEGKYIVIHYNVEGFDESIGGDGVESPSVTL
jgi:hypothetical protein